MWDRGPTSVLREFSLKMPDTGAQLKLALEQSDRLAAIGDLLLLEQLVNFPVSRQSLPLQLP